MLKRGSFNTYFTKQSAAIVRRIPVIVALTGIILCMSPANGRRRYNVMPSPFAGRIHTAMTTPSNGNIFRVTGPLRGDSPHKGQWRGALMFSWICLWTKGSVNNRYASDLRRHCAHYDVIVMASTRTCEIMTWKQLSALVALCEGNHRRRALIFSLALASTVRWTKSRIIGNWRYFNVHVTSR